MKKAVAGADGTTDVLAQDVTTSPLKIEDTAKFFKAKANGGNNLIEFKLLAKYTDSSQASKSADLALNTTEYITEDGEDYQPGNTYQIINKDDVYSKLYWGADGGEDANKLIFEIPIELPEQVKVEDTDYKIESFEVSTQYMNSEYIDKPAEKLDGENKSKGITYTLNSGDKTAVAASADNSKIEANTIIPEYVKDTGGNIYAVTSIAKATYIEGVGSEGSFVRCSNLKTVVIGKNVTSIGEMAFNDCSNLSSVTIPDSVTSIENSVFGGCSSLTSITIPDGVTSIDSCTFCSCSSLASVEIPDRVTSIGASAFSDCTSLTSITIKSTQLNTVASDAFNNISDSATFYVPASKVGEYKTLLGKTNVQPISE